ncbi:MAG: DUF6464 family protein [Microcoleaceae cyanobacterium]
MSLKAILILALGLSPSIIAWWLRRRIGNQFLTQLRTVGTSVHGIRQQLSTYPPDTRYVEGVGFLIGDITCKYNACSSQMRCAVNPAGPCETCRDYEVRESLQTDLQEDLSDEV